VIPADHIAIDGDTAWVVIPERFTTHPPADWTSKDRPCDTCGGCGAVDIPEDEEHFNLTEPCPDCDGTGRHTFEIEVANPNRPDGWLFPARTLRVSVVPGMVLPITEDTDAVPKHDPHIIQFDGRCGGEPYTEFVPCDGRQTDDPIDHFPPAAEPGMWAVQLRIAP
jgi:hypothetical protein